MKPDKCNPKCNLGHNRPGECNQTLFGFNLENRDGVILLHGDLKKKEAE